MKDQRNVQQKKTGGKKSLVILIIAVFSLGFLFGTYKTLSILREDKDSETAYNDLRGQLTVKATPQPVISDIPVESNAETEDTEAAVTEAAAVETGEPQTETATPQPVISDIPVESNAETEDTEAAKTEAAAVETGEPQTETAALQLVNGDIPNDGDTETEDTAVTAAVECSAKRQQSMDMKSLKEAYPQMQAWIMAEDTKIDYPVMQAADNNYYLSHLYDGKSNANGSIFMDYRNSGVFTDDNTVFYGHNMKNGSMFHVLMEFKTQDFYEAHPTMMIYTEEGDYLVELICGTVENGDYEFVEFNFDDFDEMNGYVDKLKKKSTFESEVVLLPGDKLISMCTCTYERDNARYMLLGKVTALYE